MSPRDLERGPYGVIWPPPSDLAPTPGVANIFRNLLFFLYLFVVALRELPALYLGLLGNHLSVTLAQRLTELVAQCTFTSLDLRENRLTDTGVLMLPDATAIRANSISRLAKIQLQGDFTLKPSLKV